MARPGSGRFVGREEELRTCQQALDDVEQGEPQTVLVLGEPGLGKTRLSSAVASLVRERGGLVLTSHGLSLDGGELPYGLVAELLHDLARQRGGPYLQDVLADGLEALGPLARPESANAGGPVDRVSVFAAVVELLRRLAAEQPVCWWIEDLQWSDQSSRDIARYVSRVSEGCRLLLLATIRTEPAGSSPVSSTSWSATLASWSCDSIPSTPRTCASSWPSSWSTATTAARRVSGSSR